jgi:hypothetical protein
MSRILLHLAVCALCSVSAVAQNTKDAATYAPTATGEQLTNVYLNSAILNGGNAVLPGGVAGDSRGMAVVNGKMYVCCREGAVSKLIELDGKTGALLRTINLPEEMWKEGDKALGFICNDVQVDNAGHIFVSNMATDMRGEGAAHLFRVNYVDVTKTPVAYKTVLNATLPGDLPQTMRIDTYDLYGDILNGDGIIMLPVSGNEAGAGNTVIKYTVTKGVADVANPQTIVLTKFNPEKAVAAGAAPRINIVDNELFYHDGFNTMPMLYDMNGAVVDGFQNNKPLTPTSTGQNGVTEFELNGAYYLIVASTNTDDKEAPQAFDIFKFKDEGRSFADMTFLYRFPQAGLGSVGNPVRTALPRVEIVDGVGGQKKARINIYAYKNGYGIYEFANNVSTNIAKVEGDKLDYMVRGNVITVNADVKSIALYNAIGQKVAETANEQTIKAPARGVYLLNVLGKNGTAKTIKVVVN